ncbi:uncharacterized protein [Choristoneura fumiferana]|uniref:uncharacterized protein n=1 Tax=Choristoneura fumiferana TaxID=7141 RepID=UPI003D159BE3
MQKNKLTMNREASRGSGCRAPSKITRCSCTDCDNSFCGVKINETNRCNKCREYETSVYYYGEEARSNSRVANDTDTSNRVFKLNMDLNATESKTRYKFNKNVTDDLDVNVAENEKDAAEVQKVGKNNSQKGMSNTTAHLSAQIMNLSFKDYKESVSVEKTRAPQKVLSNANDIFKKIKEAYDACTCKICECLIGKSLPSPDKPCDCEPCNCKDCTNYRKGLTNSGVDPRIIPLMQLDKTENEIRQSKKCDCKPCECVQCGESNPEPCSCKPCQCVECKSMVIHKTKTIIVAPMEEGSQRAHCLCSPCDCTRCTHRGLNLSPNRVHEMSTGINRHPNCHCEACMNEACEPNGTDSCRCETRRGIMSKPFDRNPHDFNIHRATVYINPLKKNTKQSKPDQTISIYAAKDTTHFPIKSEQSNTKKCMCKVCECIVCQCKDKDLKNSKTSQICDNKSLKAVKIPSVHATFCKCSPCECKLCSNGNQTNFGDSKTKNCECQVCDCLYCEGALQPLDDISSILPITITCGTNKCNCGPSCKCDSLQRTLRRNNDDKNYINNDKLFDEDFYPIKNEEFIRSSILQNDALSEPELLSKSSEYTQLKHSRGQSNVFKNEASAHKISKQNLTIYHVIPERKFKPPFYNSELSSGKRNNSDLNDSKNENGETHDIFEKKKEDKDLTEFYYASTSKSSSSGAKLEIPDQHYTRNNVLESVITACLKDAMDPSTCYKSQTPSLLSIPLSTHNLLNLSNSSITYSRKSHQLTISSPNEKVDSLSASIHVKNDKKYIMNLLETYGNDNIRSPPKYKVKQCECNICQCCATCEDQNDLSKMNANEVTQTFYDGTSCVEDDDCFLCNRFETYFKSNLPDGKSDSAVEKNRRKTTLNRKEGDMQNKYCAWKTENGNPRPYSSVNTIDLLLPRKSAPYERALKTLQKAKEFSLELGRLLEKYERANLEYESISKKLKQSHESIFNNFNYNSCYARPRPDYISQTHEYFKNKVNNSSPLYKKMPLIDENAKKPIHKTESISTRDNYGENFSVIDEVTVDRSIGTITTNSLKSLCLNYSDKFRSSTSEDFVDKCYENNSVINGSVNPISDLLNQKAGEVINDKQPDEMKLTEKYYNIYRKLMQRTAHVTKLSEINLIPAESQTFDCDTLKKLIKQKMKTLVKQLCEIEKKSKSGNAFGDETRLSNILAVVEELKAQNIMGVDTITDISKETKTTMKVIEPSKIEAMDPVKVPSTQNTATLVKNWGTTESLPAAPAIHNISKENIARIMTELEEQKSTMKGLTKSMGSTTLQSALGSTELQSLNKSKNGLDDMKVCFLGVRRVSDHTVTVKWEKPKAANDVQGYEILVDGLPVQKILNPARCMAVITCLPHSERILLSIRTIAKKLVKNGPYPCSTIVYRPRSK